MKSNQIISHQIKNRLRNCVKEQHVRRTYKYKGMPNLSRNLVHGFYRLA
jgi:hypothetical protein